MSVDATELQRRRETMNGESPSSKERVDKIWKWFTSEDKQYAIEAAPSSKITLGHPPNAMDVIILPMSPAQVVKAFGTLRKLLIPILGVMQMQEAGKTPSMAALISALGEHIEELPNLLFIICSRGNPMITEEYINEHIDFTFDTMAILKVFVEQNGLLKFFADRGNAPSGTGEAKAPEVPPVVQPMAESLPQSTSSADTTDG